MSKPRSLKTLSYVIFGSALFDLFGGFYFILMVGVDRAVSTPPTHNFYAVMLGMFLICFSYLLFLIASDLKRYLPCLGVTLLSRVFYVILFAYYFMMEGNNMLTFLPTAIADALWVMLIVLLIALNNEVSLKDLLSQRE